jgi:hypothetical protein
VRAAARLRHIHATSNHHDRAGEPEQHRDTDAESIPDSIGDQHGVALADRETHAHERPRDTDAAGACSVLRRR